MIDLRFDHAVEVKFRIPPTQRQKKSFRSTSNVSTADTAVNAGTPKPNRRETVVRRRATDWPAGVLVAGRDTTAGPAGVAPSRDSLGLV
jgi:hypothetical protein